MTNALCEVELVNAQIELKEPIVAGFFIVQYAKLRKFELYYNFFFKFSDVNLFEEWEMDTESFYFALAERDLEVCIRPEMRAEWEQLRSKDCTDWFIADAVGNMFPQMSCDNHKKNRTSESLVFPQSSSGVRKSCVFVIKLTAATTLPLTSWNSAAKD